MVTVCQADLPIPLAEPDFAGEDKSKFRHRSTRPYEFIGFGAMDATKPYEFIGFGAMDVTKPYKFIGFGAMDVTKPYKFIGLGPWTLADTKAEEMRSRPRGAASCEP